MNYSKILYIPLYVIKHYNSAKNLCQYNYLLIVYPGLALIYSVIQITVIGSFLYKCLNPSPATSFESNIITNDVGSNFFAAYLTEFTSLVLQAHITTFFLPRYNWMHVTLFLKALYLFSLPPLYKTLLQRSLKCHLTSLFRVFS